MHVHTYHWNCLIFYFGSMYIHRVSKIIRDFVLSLLLFFIFTFFLSLYGFFLESVPSIHSEFFQRLLNARSLPSALRVNTYSFYNVYFYSCFVDRSNKYKYYYFYYSWLKSYFIYLRTYFKKLFILNTWCLQQILKFFKGLYYSSK